MSKRIETSLLEEIAQLLEEGSGSIEIVTQDGRNLTLSIFPTAVFPLKSRIDDLNFLDDE